MSLYRTVHIQMWSDENFRSLSPDAQRLWLYLLTGPETLPVPGAVPIGKAALAENLDTDSETVMRWFSEIESRNMAFADWKARLIWLPNSIKHNPPANQNIVTGWKAYWGIIPQCQLKSKLFDSLREHCKSRGEQFLKSFDSSISQGRETVTQTVPVTVPDTVKPTVPATVCQTGIGVGLGIGTVSGLGTETEKKEKAATSPLAPIADGADENFDVTPQYPPGRSLTASLTIPSIIQTQLAVYTGEVQQQAWDVCRAFEKHNPTARRGSDTWVKIASTFAGTIAANPSAYDKLLAYFNESDAQKIQAGIKAGERENPNAAPYLVCDLLFPSQRWNSDKNKADENARAKSMMDEAMAKEAEKRKARMAAPRLPPTPPPRLHNPREVVANVANGFGVDQ